MIGLVILYRILTIMASETASNLNNSIDQARVLAYLITVTKHFRNFWFSM